jgi:hypothetical protein
MSKDAGVVTDQVEMGSAYEGTRRRSRSLAAAVTTGLQARPLFATGNSLLRAVITAPLLRCHKCYGDLPAASTLILSRRCSLQVPFTIKGLGADPAAAQAVAGKISSTVANPSGTSLATALVSAGVSADMQETAAPSVGADLTITGADNPYHGSLHDVAYTRVGRFRVRVHSGMVCGAPLRSSVC